MTSLTTGLRTEITESKKERGTNELFWNVDGGSYRSIVTTR